MERLDELELWRSRSSSEKGEGRFQAMSPSLQGHHEDYFESTSELRVCDTENISTLIQVKNYIKGQFVSVDLSWCRNHDVARGRFYRAR